MNKGKRPNTLKSQLLFGVIILAIALLIGLISGQLAGI